MTVRRPKPRKPPLAGLAAAAVAAACAAAYANSLHGVFIFDDIDSIVTNPHIGSIGGSWDAAFPVVVKGGPTILGRPLLALTLALNYAASGLRPWSYHVLNALIHAAAAAVLFGVVRRTVARLEPAAPEGRAPVPARPAPPGGPGEAGAGPVLFALAVALLWGLHPLQTESVSYVVQRAESMGGLLFLLSFYCFIRSVEAAGRSRALARGLWEIGAVAATLLGDATKETAALVPVLVLLYDRAFVAGSLSLALRLRWRLHAALAGTWVTLLSFVAAAGWNRNGSVGVGVDVRPWAYWLTQPEALCRYLALSLWPHPLVFEYGKAWAPGLLAVLPWTIPVLALAAWTAWALVRRPRAGFLGAWFLGILAPTSLLPGTTEMIVEHRMYLPLAAVVAGAVWALGRAWGRPALWALCAWSVVLGVMTVRRNEIYRSETALWTQTIARRPSNTEVRYRLAVTLMGENRMEEALAAYRDLLRIEPGDYKANAGYGVALCLAGRQQEAIGPLQAALAARPGEGEVHEDLGNAFISLGRYGDAERQFRLALRLEAGRPRVWGNLGRVLEAQGRHEEAERAYVVALRYEPGSDRFLAAFAGVLEAEGRTAEAVDTYGRALQVNPGNASIWISLGNIFIRAARWPEAASAYGRALQLGSNGADLHNNMGIALMNVGRGSQAIAEFETALRIDPTYAIARENLSRAGVMVGGARP